MDDYAGRVLADRYRLPLPSADADDFVETRAFDTYSGQEVRIRQVPLPEVVDAEFVDDEPYAGPGRATRRPAEPAVRRAVEAAQAAARIPDHPRLDQVFDVFAEAGSLWIVSEFVAATPLSEILSEGPLTPYRAAEIGADLLTALRTLHAHGWTHRNVTARTVLVCDDGRVVLTGLAAGAAEEALCGYAPVPLEEEALPYVPYGGPQETYEDPGAREEPEAYDEQGVYEALGAGPDVRELEPYEPYEPYASEIYGRGGAPAAAGAEPYAHVPAAREPARIEPGDPDRAAWTGHHDDADAYEGADDAPDGPYAEPDDGPYAEPDDGPYGEPYAEPDGGPDTPDAPSRAGYGPDGGTPYGPGNGTERAESPAASAAPPGPAVPPAADVRAARAGAIAAYRAGARAAARIGETGSLPVQRPAPPAPPEPPPAGPPAAPEPQWWSRVDAEDDDVDDEDETGGTYGPPPPRAYLTGSWSDGPHASRDGGRSVPAGGGGQGPALPALPAGYTAAAPQPPLVPAAAHRPPGGPDDAYRGPATRLAAERARQTRMAVVGAVTERWAPEQAGPVHEHWRLAPPIGPATDLWALGALLYRAVQGHAPYPEDNTAELVQLVCAEPPAFAEECGPLRPVVESLLRQDPTERPDVEELSGWLRSLVRSAPEPEAGIGVVPLPSPDATKLPIVRRRGELVRRRRGGAGGGRHRQGKGGRAPRGAAYAAQADAPLFDAPVHEEIPQRAPRAPRAPGRPSGSPRSLGRTLLLLVLLLLGGAIAYAVLFMPRQGEEGGRTGTPPAKSGSPAQNPPKSTPPPASGSPSTRPTSATGTPPATGPSAPALAAGYALRKDPEGFQLGVPRDWRRSPINDAGQVRYTGGDFTLIVVPGRDTVQANGADPMAYQRTKERELQPWRDSSWSSASGLRRIDVGRQAMAVGQFTWQDSTGREVFVRNLALIEGGRYHVVQVIGPENERDKVSEIYDQAVKAYRVTR
ncbi:protein kinase [Streptomyces sp. NPDC058084]|uniref:protein kinase n=1 Tax=Streptomyces sp. NPDC058084 TaxID=3346333 RepID=UPI0036E8AED8